jgi:small-conductance mechanosensitive channel
MMALLTQVAKEHVDILAHPPPETQFAGFGTHALEFKLGAWTGRPERGGSIRSELCVQIYKVLTRENIEIPYPQSTLHLRSLDSGVLDTFRSRPRRKPHDDAEPAGKAAPAEAGGDY